MTDRAAQAARRIAAHLSQRRPELMTAVWVDEWAGIIREETKLASLDKLSAIRALAEQYQDHAMNVGAELLAKKILDVVGGTEG